MFWTDFLSIIRSLVLYTQQQVYVIQVLLTACSRDQDGTPNPSIKQSAKPVCNISFAVYTVLDS